MFKWIDYEQNSALFIEGINTSVALLTHKNFGLKDSITDSRVKIIASNLDEAKIHAEMHLEKHWKDVYKNLGNILELIK